MRSMPLSLLLLVPPAIAFPVPQEIPQATATPPARVGGYIKEPRKLKDVAPEYPEEAKKARIQGVVILECTISPKGRVVDVKVMRGVPGLDKAAIDAVRQWEYSPTLVDGQAVSLIMNVTVNFRLDQGSVGIPAAPGAPPATPPAPLTPAVPLSPEREADLRRLLQALRVDQRVGQQLDQIIDSQRKQLPEVPAEFWEAFRADNPAAEVEGAMLRALDASLSPDDVKAAVGFFESDAGRHFLNAQPRIMQELSVVGLDWGRRALEKLQERLRKAGYTTG